MISRRQGEGDAGPRRRIEEADDAPGIRDCVAIANNVLPYPPPAEVSRSDGGGYCRDCSPEQSEAARLGNAPYDEHYGYINTSTPYPRQRGTRKDITTQSHA